MTDNLLEDYKAYYSVRAEKYAGNPNFPNYYAAEKRLSDAMQSCHELIEFKDKIGDLNERCATALTKDQYIMEQKHFEKHQEVVRVLLAKRIIEKVDSINNVTELITMVNDESNKNMLEVTLDEANWFFAYEWEFLDMAEVYANAVVPDKYKQGMQEVAAIVKKNIAESAKSTEAHMDAFQKGWRLTPDVILEFRHRRLFPLSDEHIKEHLEKFKIIINA